jgi:GDP-L-fucose synthase
MNIKKSLFTKIIKQQLSQINIGTGKGISIKKLSTIISKVINYNGNIFFDKNYPDGHPKKVGNISKQISLIGNIAKTCLEEGINKTYLDFLKRIKK